METLSNRQKHIVEYLNALRSEAAQEFKETIERAYSRNPRAIVIPDNMDAIDEIQTNNPKSKTATSTYAAEANIRYVNQLEERGLG